MKNPAEGWNPLSFLLLWYSRHVFWKCKHRRLGLDDVYDPLPSDESEYLGNRLQSEWDEELRKQKRLLVAEKSLLSYEPSLAKALFRMFFWQIMNLKVLQQASALLVEVLLPLFLGRVIRYFEVDTEREIVWQATWMVLLKIVGAFLNQHANRLALMIGLRTRIACSALIYNKSLRLATSELNENPVKNVTELMSGNCFDACFKYVHYTWITPIQVILISKIMWDRAGASPLVGVSMLLILSILINSSVFYAKIRAQPKIALLTDARMRRMTELVSKIKVLKMYAWERPLEQVVGRARSAELRRIAIPAHADIILAGSSVYAGRLAVLATLVLFALANNKLTAELSFVLVVYFNTLHWSVMHYFPRGLASFQEALKSVRLMEQYMRLKEVNNSKIISKGQKRVLNKEKVLRQTEPEDDEHCRVPVEVDLLHASANWSSHQAPPTLNRLSFKIEPGSFCVVFGEVGSGKTSLLSLILRELPLSYGAVGLRQSTNNDSQNRVHRCGFYMDNPQVRVSYASQEPWYFDGSVYENIVFGQTYNNDRYNEVKKVCALQAEMKRLPKGDKTPMKKLTFEQRTLVHLARAVYRVADLYLLDDFLGNLNENLQQKILDHCVCDFLKGKTRIVVTKNLDVLREVDSALVLERGNLKYHGPYDKIRLSSGITEISKKLKSSNEKLRKSEGWRSRSDDEVSESEDTVQQRDFNYASFLKTYFRAGCNWYFIFFLVSILVLTQAFATGTDFWLENWIRFETSDRVNITLGVKVISSTDDFIYTYGGILAVCVVLCFFNNCLFARIGMRSSNKLHQTMFSNLLRTSLGFFTKKSTGRILEPFSRDTKLMDTLLPLNFYLAIQAYLATIGIFGIVTVVDFWMVLLILKIAVVFLCAKTVFLNTALDLKNLEVTTQKRVFRHVKSSMRGLTTIRSCSRSVKKTKEMYYAQLNEYVGARWMSITTDVAFRIFLELTLASFTGAIVYKFVLPTNKNFSGASVGLALSQALILPGIVEWGFKHFVSVVLQTQSAEKILEYANLPNESPPDVVELMIRDWPRRGRIVFRNVSLKDEESFALKNINLTIESGWKVGVVGHGEYFPITDALFRLSDRDCLLGEIRIDGVDTKNVNLETLRTSISIIPQDPKLFPESLRSNLDPFGKFSDTAMYEALQEVQLNDLTLDQQVDESLDIDQRFLVCLARAILHRNSILVIEEPSDDVNANTNVVLKNTMRRRFGETTVVTLARRLHNVIDFDRVVVMDKATVAEVGCPHELLVGNPDGHFSRMISRTGDRMSERLRKLAEESCLKNIQQRSLDIVDRSLDVIDTR